MKIPGSPPRRTTQFLGSIIVTGFRNQRCRILSSIKRRFLKVKSTHLSNGMEIPRVWFIEHKANAVANLRIAQPVQCRGLVQFFFGLFRVPAAFVFVQNTLADAQTLRSHFQELIIT